MSHGEGAEMYREHILDHYRNPRNFGELPDATLESEGTNPLCGDELHLAIKVEDDRLASVRFRGKGCAISQASTSMLTEHVTGLSLQEAQDVTREDVLELIGIPVSPVRMKCALLGLVTLKDALGGD